MVKQFINALVNMVISYIITLLYEVLSFDSNISKSALIAFIVPVSLFTFSFFYTLFMKVNNSLDKKNSITNLIFKVEKC